MAKATTAPATPQTPEFDWKAYLSLAREAIGRKLEGGDVQSDPMLVSCANFYLASDLPDAISHPGIKSFVMDVKRKSQRYGISPNQAKGVLNTAYQQITAAEGQEENKPKFDGNPVVPNGTYTIVNNGDMDDYVTIRLKDDWRDTAPLGSQVAQFLSGPDNSTSFTGYAFVQGSSIKIWSRFNSDTRIADALRFLIENDTDGEALGHARETYAVKSGRCSNCGKKLTVAVSLFRGLGPDCAARLGVK